MAEMTGTLQTATRFIARHRGLILPAGAAMMIFVVLVPLSPAVMDVLLAGNIALAAIILLTSIGVSSPLEFSVFPSVLLGATLDNKRNRRWQSGSILNRAGQRTGVEFIQHPSETEDVRSLVCPLGIQHLLWGRVPRRAHEGASHCLPRGFTVDNPAKSKVSNNEIAVVIQEHIVWLEVPMDHAFRMCVVHSIQDLGEDRVDSRCIAHKTWDFRPQGTLVQRHDVEVGRILKTFADHVYDIGMVQSPEDANFTGKALNRDFVSARV